MMQNILNFDFLEKDLGLVSKQNICTTDIPYSTN